jgi:hypothetical protein
MKLLKSFLQCGQHQMIVLQTMAPLSHFILFIKNQAHQEEGSASS